MSTHNICFHGETRKIICRCPLLSGAMVKTEFRSKLQGNLKDMYFSRYFLRTNSARHNKCHGKQYRLRSDTVFCDV